MRTMQNLCEAIGLAEPVTQQVLLFERAPQPPALRAATDKLRREADWEQGLRETKTLLGEDPDGFRLLACMLRCALACEEEFRARGFSEKIFVETIACFSRFVREHRVSFGRYGFDRGFWTVRQVSVRLFRIGQLEYELLEENGQKAVSLHIPSDARLELPLLRASYEEAKPLLGKAFPEFARVPYVCGSWLLSPMLGELLPPSSRILAFQRSFDIKKTYPDEDFREWVYKRRDIPNAELPEDTGLQRNLKVFLLAGGTFLSGEGVLREEPFL